LEEFEKEEAEKKEKEEKELKQLKEENKARTKREPTKSTDSEGSEVQQDSIKSTPDETSESQASEYEDVVVNPDETTTSTTESEEDVVAIPKVAQLPHSPPTNFDTIEAEDALRATLSNKYGSDALINMEVEVPYENDNDGQSDDDVPLASCSKASTAKKVIAEDKNMVEGTQSQSDERGTDESNTSEESVIGTRERKKFTRKRGPTLPAPSDKAKRSNSNSISRNTILLCR
jgi:hypothetical protein